MWWFQARNDATMLIRENFMGPVIDRHNCHDMGPGRDHMEEEEFDRDTWSPVRTRSGGSWPCSPTKPRPSHRPASKIASDLFRPNCFRGGFKAVLHVDSSPGIGFF